MDAVGKKGKEQEEKRASPSLRTGMSAEERGARALDQSEALMTPFLVQTSTEQDSLR